MANRAMELKGFDELRAELRALPMHLQREAAVIVQAQAEAAKREIAAAYPVRTGNLRAGLVVRPRHDVGSAAAILLNVAVTPSNQYINLANIYEHGTKARFWRRNKNRTTGKMPRRPVFFPIADRRRAIAFAALVDLVERNGLKVSGVAA